MAEQITMRLSVEDRGTYWATLKSNRTEAKVQPESRSGAKAESGLNRDDPLYLFVCAFVRGIFRMGESELKARQRAKSRTGPRSESKTKSEPKSRMGLGSKTNVGIGSESSVTRVGVENETGIKIDIDRYRRRKIHFTSMLVQLRPLTIRPSHLQESTK
ncbi:hypothetical protein EVAR_8005_1 [Eumeta japonica]|uniref:Uncharacterized protein n=1 Tax=Eumeta variegata TaxID=151549 RepID=A0A4C1TH20_EUMVA|nr:hypothetical protein EVAR_8005_1 [Eumeta japonica]